jgi:amino acid efflux transporter
MVSLLIVVVIVAVAGSAASAHAANWTPFAPHGWLAVGHAATTLMLSFVGWEAVAPLTAQFADPARQLPRVVGITLAVTSVLYLGLAVVTIAVLGTGGGSMAPLADLLRRAIGPAGTAAGAVAAIVLTLGAVNAYVNGAAAMTGRLLGGPRRPAGTAAARPAAGAANGRRPGRLLLLAAIAGTGLPLIALYGVGLVSPVSLVAIPTTLFLAVYLGSMLAATRVLHGLARLAAVPATAATAIMLAYCGWALAVPAAIIAVVTVTGSIRRSR